MNHATTNITRNTEAKMSKLCKTFRNIVFFFLNIVFKYIILAWNLITICQSWTSRALCVGQCLKKPDCTYMLPVMCKKNVCPFIICFIWLWVYVFDFTTNQSYGHYGKWICVSIVILLCFTAHHPLLFKLYIQHLCGHTHSCVQHISKESFHESRMSQLLSYGHSHFMSYTRYLRHHFWPCCPHLSKVSVAFLMDLHWIWWEHAI